jgi:hypothetical protein
VSGPALDCHFYSVLHTDRSPAQIAELYRPRGWRVGKASWFDYSLVCEWADLVIEDAGYLLMHGPLADAVGNADQILAPLRDAGVRYEAEFYDGDHELLHQVAWGFS